MSDLVDYDFMKSFTTLEEFNHQYIPQNNQQKSSLLANISKAEVFGNLFKMQYCDAIQQELIIIGLVKVPNLIFDIAMQLTVNLKKMIICIKCTFIEGQNYLLVNSIPKRIIFCRKLVKFNEQNLDKDLKLYINMETGKLTAQIIHQSQNQNILNIKLVETKIHSLIRKINQSLNKNHLQLILLISKIRYQEIIMAKTNTYLIERNRLKNEEMKYIKLMKQIEVSHINFGLSAKVQTAASSNSIEKQKNQEKMLRQITMNKNNEQLESSITRSLFYSDYYHILGIDKGFFNYQVQPGQAAIYNSYLKTPNPKDPNPGENKYIFNFIQVFKPDKVIFSDTQHRGGNSYIKMARISFAYQQTGSSNEQRQMKMRSQRAFNNQKKQQINNTLRINNGELSKFNFKQCSHHKSTSLFGEINPHQKSKEIQNQKRTSILTKYIAVKIPKKQPQHFKEIHQQLKHPSDYGPSKFQNQRSIIKHLKSAMSAYILKYYVSNQNNFIFPSYLMMDYLPNSCPLSAYMQIHKQSLSLNSKLFIIVNLSNSLRFLKDYQIAHMDLNLNNILMYKDYLTKVIDFGESYTPYVPNIGSKRGYTFPFSSPQYFTRRKDFTTKQDVFSLGIILYRLIFNTYPFFDSQKLKKCYKNKTYLNKIFLAPERGQDYVNSPESIYLIYNLFFKCIQPDEKYRCQPSWLTIFFKLIYYYMV